jgi:hypothetical protein
MMGKLLYYLAQEPFLEFLPTYISEGRSVQEQVLILPDESKQAILAFLEHNLQPENRAYKYDFLYDNCATRLRDILPQSLGSGFQFGEVLPAGSKLTFRQTIDRYLATKHWERFGIDLLLGSPVDRRMDNMTAQYLPNYLRVGLANASFQGQKVAEKPVVLLPQSQTLKDNPVNGPLLLTLGLLLLTAVLWSLPTLRSTAIVFTRVYLFIIGLLGSLMLFMWLGTDHQACQRNWNILWALPFGVLAPFLGRAKLKSYSLFALILLPVALLVHVSQLQGLPLLEIWPLLLSLAWCYGMIYRTSHS